MGRRPNQLILEYFERGPKLEDASNRYQHTCKSCGEKFPKGRIDSLTTHLVKKCPALPLRDRQRALLQFHELPVPDGMHGAHAKAATKPLSALETLAEVSRQHLDLKRVADKQPASSAAHTLLDEFIVHDDRPGEPDLAAVDLSAGPVLPPMYQFSSRPMALSSSAPMAQMVPSLVMAASAANDLMPLAGSLPMEPDMNLASDSIGILQDKFFHTPSRPHWSTVASDPLDPLLQDHGREESASKDPASPRPIVMNPHTHTHFTTDFSMDQKPSKPKARGRFSDVRRKEVQEVRKRGACIRCRMLKKPCSGDNPCNTCRNVESARLWKQPCIRTRIAEEFNLYSAGLHGVLAYHATNQAKGSIRLDQPLGRIEASHVLDVGNFAAFSPLKCSHTSEPRQGGVDPTFFPAWTETDVQMIDGDDDIGGKLDLYVKQASPLLIVDERSVFLKTTLQTASTMAMAQEDGLLTKVIQLSHFTNLLVSRKHDWHLFFNSSLAPPLSPAVINASQIDEASRISITIINQPQSYRLIKMQLMGAIEKRSACLARVIMNDLERRLLQRQQSNSFETFLVSVLLLSCVERMCWLFRSWEVEPSFSNSDGVNALQNDSAAVYDTNSRHPHWPLDKPAASFSQQGERFSDVLNMLLKMRGVPPKSAKRGAEGAFTAWGDEVEVGIRNWYESIASIMSTLDERAKAPFVGQDASEWELKYVAKIIRGD